jgi:hypothetical protein
MARGGVRGREAAEAQGDDRDLGDAGVLFPDRADEVMRDELGIVRAAEEVLVAGGRAAVGQEDGRGRVGWPVLPEAAGTTSAAPTFSTYSSPSRKIATRAGPAGGDSDQTARSNIPHRGRSVRSVRPGWGTTPVSSRRSSNRAAQVVGPIRPPIPGRHSDRPWLAVRRSRAPTTMHPAVPAGRLIRVTDLLQRLRRLWTEPVGDASAASAVFAQVYADPVVVNGVPMTVAQLADRARSLQRSFDRLSMQILDQVETSDRLVIAFILRGRHVGPYPSPLGTIPPTGREIAVRTIDVLTIQDGLVSGIAVVADDLGLLTQLDAITPADKP